MKVSRRKLDDITRYYELKRTGNDVLAGLLRTSSFSDLDMVKLERAVKDGTLEVDEAVNQHDQA